MTGTDAELLTDGWGIYILNHIEQIDKQGLLKSNLQERQYLQALEQLEQLFHTQGDLWEDEEELIYMNCKGVLLTIEGRYKEAEVILRQLIQKTEESNPTDEVIACIYNNYGTAFGAMGYLDVFEEFLTMAEGISHLENFYQVVSGTNLVLAKYMIDNRNNMGKAHDADNAKIYLKKMKNHYSQVEILFEQKKKLNKSDILINAMLLRNKGNICMNLLRKPEAMACFSEALELNKNELGDDLLEGGIYIWLGQLLGVFEIFDDAQDAFVSAENAYKRYNSHYLRIGEVNALKAQFQMMEKNFEAARESLETALKYGEPYDIVSGIVYNMISGLYAYEGNQKEAIKWNLKAYKIYQEKGYMNKASMINYIYPTYLYLEIGSEEEFDEWLQLQISQIDLEERQYLE